MELSQLNEWVKALRREDNCLAGSLSLPFGGRSVDVDVSIEVGETGVATDAQLATLGGLFERVSDIRGQVLDRVFGDYQKVVEKYRKAYREWGEDPDKNAPLVAGPEQLAPLLEPTSLFIPANYGAGTFGMGFWSRWEQEHGVGVQFVLWHLTDVGESAIHFDFD